MKETKKMFKKDGWTKLCYILAAVIGIYTIYVLGSTIAYMVKYYQSYGMSITSELGRVIMYVIQQIFQPLVLGVVVLIAGRILNEVRLQNPDYYCDAKAEKKHKEVVIEDVKHAAAVVEDKASETVAVEDEYEMIPEEPEKIEYEPEKIEYEPEKFEYEQEPAEEELTDDIIDRIIAEKKAEMEKAEADAEEAAPIEEIAEAEEVEELEAAEEVEAAEKEIAE